MLIVFKLGEISHSCSKRIIHNFELLGKKTVDRESLVLHLKSNSVFKKSFVLKEMKTEIKLKSDSQLQ